MAQDVLEPGEIATLAQREIPRIILPRRDTLFADRAVRLRQLAAGNPIAGYLVLMAALADGQQAELDALPTSELQRMQAAALAQQPAAATSAGMPPLHAASLRRDPRWREVLRALCRRCADAEGLPAEAATTLERLANSPDDKLEAQADALLAVPGAPAVDAATAPFVMAALQVYWTALGLASQPGALAPMADAPGLCPRCGSTPVASVVHARAPYAGYRYLACGLCACQWHFVRVQCSRCGAAGKDIAYQSLAAADASTEALKDIAVRAETCEHCHGYRKILYEEKDHQVEALADDLAMLPLDLLLAEQGYARMSPHPLLWQSSEE